MSEHVGNREEVEVVMRALQTQLAMHAQLDSTGNDDHATKALLAKLKAHTP